MAVHIRLARFGTKKTPFYRLVVTDSRSPRGGRFIERIGTFDPCRTQLFVDASRLEHWLSKGAQPSQTVSVLMKKQKKAQAAAAAATAASK